MPLLVKTYSLDPQADSHVDGELKIRLAKQQLQGQDARGNWRDGSTWLLLYPNSPSEPRFRRYAVGFVTVGFGSSSIDLIKGRGQVVLTGHRILGLVVEGSRNADPLSEASGKLAAFSLRRSSIASANFPTNWRGSPKRVQLGASSTGSKPLDILLDIQAVVLSVLSDGKTHASSVAEFVRQLDSGAARGLL
ncbi:MAG TPA: hypothetical protein VLJ42_00370 [Solirubrobacteraceae bacterium]|nr:hypothetical protein [Solirubrobacteraceae bacterium]